MNQIGYTGDAHTFGLEFNYSVWTPNTVAQFCNVPWDMSYRDVVQFDSPAALDEWINSRSYGQITIEHMTYAKPGAPIRVDLPFNMCWQFNYIRVFNPQQPIRDDLPRSYYYFITDCRYISPNCTEIQVQLDVWQTFIHLVRFGSCYVERGHVGIANVNQFSGYGRDFLTVPEGLDCGSEYMIVDTKSKFIASARKITGVPKMLVCVTSTTEIETDWGTLENPNLKTGTGSRFEDIPNGCSVYVFTMEDFTMFTEHVANYPWVSQGIISVVAIPDFNLDRPGINKVEVPGSYCYWRLQDGVLDNIRLDVAPDFRNQISIPHRYRNLKKFMVYPYTVIEMTTYAGTPILLKPECIDSNDLSAVQLMHIVPPSPRIMFYPYKYNANGSGDISIGKSLWYDGGEAFDMMTGFSNLPTFSVVNNSYLSYMAANTHSIAYGYQSADWSQQRALASNNLAYGQASASIAANSAQNTVSTSALNQHTALNNQTSVYRGALSGANSVVSNLQSSNFIGAIMGVANAAADTAISVNQSTQSAGIDANRMAASVGIQNNLSSYVRDTNKAYADFAANGDYQNAIAGLNAKVQDAKMIQPTTSGQVGGDAHLLAVYGWGIHFKIKQIQPAIMSMIGDYWLRYGYAVNRWHDMNWGLKCMTKFTYWKLRETYITIGICPETYKATIRGIMEKGVTVWNAPEDIGRIDLSDNDPIGGMFI